MVRQVWRMGTRTGKKRGDMKRRPCRKSRPNTRRVHRRNRLEQREKKRSRFFDFDNNKDLIPGHSGLSTWKYQFSYDH